MELVRSAVHSVENMTVIIFLFSFMSQYHYSLNSEALSDLTQNEVDLRFLLSIVLLNICYDFSSQFFPKGFLLQPLISFMVCLIWECPRQVPSWSLLCIQCTSLAGQEICLFSMNLPQLGIELFCTFLLLQQIVKKMLPLCVSIISWKHIAGCFRGILHFCTR